MTALTDGSRDATVTVGAHEVYGLPVDGQTRCVHYAGRWDVVAIALPCCGRFHPCIHCHRAVAGHEPRRWSAGDDAERAVLCGACATTMPLHVYLAVADCPSCGHPFNPGCVSHRPLYVDETWRPCRVG